jgi:hypothetical protein
VWLDNAATTQKPQSVINRLSYFYARENSNVHRAAHELAAREKVRRFLNSPAPREIIFVRGATEGINLVAQSWGRHNIHQGGEIVIAWLEHHAKIVPWQMLCAEKGARLCVAPVDDTGQVILEEYEKLLNPNPDLNPIERVWKLTRPAALGTTPREQLQWEGGLVLRLWQCDKKVRAGVKAGHRPSLPSFDLGTDLHPPGRDSLERKRIQPSVASRQPVHPRLWPV